MSNALLIFFGAGFGGVCRYWMSSGFYWLLGRKFPYGTLIVNSTGCFLMGLLFTLILDRFNDIGQQLRALLLIGFLGGYTTFSSFSIETINLYESGDWLGASLNILLSITMCIVLTWLGMVLGRQL
ncbi:fluoride efflux transporter CrcB [Legionella londiniensis]|nr:fluoride efflux transporter CrcB [Legionella londiniensis]